jgi:hypothetical protein
MSYPIGVTRSKDTAIESIREFYLSDRRVELSEKEEEIRQRLMAAHALLVEYHSIERGIPVHKARFGVSDATAYRDFKDALRLFGDVKRSEKEGYRYILWEWSAKTFELAKNGGDYKTMSDIIGKMSKLMGLDRDEPDMPDFEKLQPNVYPIVMDDFIRQLLMGAISKGGSVDLSQMMNYARKNTVDAEFTEISDANENGIDPGGDRPIE